MQKYAGSKERYRMAPSSLLSVVSGTWKISKLFPLVVRRAQARNVNYSL